jgi:hypothetical protein
MNKALRALDPVSSARTAWRIGRRRTILSALPRMRRLRRPRIRLRIHRFFYRHPHLKPHLPFRRRRGWLPDDHERLYPDAPPFLGGVREPRRPKPSPPTDAVALREPRD